MDTVTPSLAGIRRKTRLVVYLINALGAMLAFLYFGLIDPLPSGGESVRRMESVELLPAALVVVVTFVAGWLWGRNYDRRIDDWYEALRSGTSATEVPERVRRDVLHGAAFTALTTAVMWFLVSLFFAWFTNSYRQFIGLAVAGLFTTTLLYLLVDLLWRPIIPVFFPDGQVSGTRAFRLPVLGRLLLVFLLVGLLPPILLMNLSWQRARALIAASNPQAVLNNLLILQLFILIVTLAASIGLAVFVTRSITYPLKRLQDAMARVGQGDFEVSVPVTTNDELGYLAERFNEMVEGLRQGERLRRLFGLYVSPEVARAAVERGADLGGELAECTILFSDLRGFTRLTEGMPPDMLVALINRYMTLMVGIIVAHGGIVTRFGGDSILALFGSPLNPMEDDASQAVEAALAMRDALERFNQAQHGAGEPTVGMGIGIATGKVVAGNVGGKERIEYTVMGDAVNLAARLQTMTKELDGQILLSEATYQAAAEPLRRRTERLPGVAIRGKREAVTIYALSVGHL